MKMSPDGLEMLKTLEKFSPTPYQDSGGKIAIAWGHNIQPGEVVPALITTQQGEAYLSADLAWAESAISNSVKVPLNQNQFDALVSFVYNVGSGAFGKSTMLKRLNQADFKVEDEFRKWIYADGVISEGLKARREKEIALFDQFPSIVQKPMVEEAPPAISPAIAPIPAPTNCFSQLFSIIPGDFLRGLVVAIMTTPLTTIYTSLSAGALTIDWKRMLTVAIAGGVGYLLKNFLTGQQGKLLTNLGGAK